MNAQNRLGSVLLFSVVLLIGIGLAAWKYESVQNQQAISANQPEPMETVTSAIARAVDHRQTTTSIGTVLALRSITLKNELAGRIREVHLIPGHVVEAGALLVALDVSVERAELRAQEAQAALSQAVLNRRKNLSQELATTQEEVDRARAGVLGVRASDIGRSIAPMTSSSRYTAPIYWADPGNGIAYQVQVQVPQTELESIEDLGNIPVASRDSGTSAQNSSTVRTGADRWESLTPGM